MLRLGRGWGIHAAGADGRTTLAASTVVLPYGTGFAWVSMVLVLPEFRRRGYASLLLRHALDALAAEGRAAILDATPAGHAVYVQEGFGDTWGFARWRREALGALAPAVRRPSAPATRALSESDWPAIEAMDTPAFGASRVALLRSLAQRLPQAARVVEQGGRLRGFVLGRDGREASQIGPLLADDPRTALGAPGRRAAGACRAGLCGLAGGARRTAGLASAAGLHLPAPLHPHGARPDDSAGQARRDHARGRPRTGLTGSGAGPTSSS